MAIVDPKDYAGIGFDPSKLPANPAMQATDAKNITQPLQQSAINANTINAGAANANVDVNTVAPRINESTNKAALTQQQVDAQNALQNAGAYFAKQGVAGKDGKVSPEVYNNYRGQYAATGSDPAQFDSIYGTKYTNPNNLFYDTPDRVAIRKSLPALASTITEYAKLPNSGPGTKTTIENLPFVNKSPSLVNYMQQKILGPEIAYNDNKKAIVGDFLKAVGAGENSTIRGGVVELGNVGGGVPDAFDDNSTANAKIHLLNQFLLKNYGTGLKDWGVPINE